ncbi:MAG: hypothetical protein KDE56_16740 [Anaerolineales bacterium]|nr:hypothetical protein [Anaerolineales bacterium]
MNRWWCLRAVSPFYFAKRPFSAWVASGKHHQGEMTGRKGQRRCQL